LPSGKGLQETEVREGLREGGKILGLFVVERPASEGEPPEFVAYIRPSWTRGYRILRTWRDRDDRAFRDFDRMLPLLRALGHDGPVTVYKAGCPELARFRGVLARDGGAREDTAADSSLPNGSHAEKDRT
jgi:hypothetical protein